jgi:uncharacterized membrane protein YfcA
LLQQARIAARIRATPRLEAWPAGLRAWLLWVTAFYGAWLVLSFGLGHWAEARQHWQVAIAMALGSFVAGSTPMGGGTVGFPVLVLLFEQPAADGRNFSFLIQSIGMSSAALFIVARRIPVEWRVVCYAVSGASVGLLFGTWWIVPLAAEATVKLLFACLWASFGLLTLARNAEICGFHGLPAIPPRAAAALGIAVGFAGGVTAALTGVGIDMLLYTVLVLLYRMDLKAAVPTSVVVMAATSVLGAALHLAIGDIDREVFMSWLAAAPVVIVGAPLGSLFVSVVPRVATLHSVALLCIAQFVWIVHDVRPSPLQWVFVTLGLGLATALYAVMYHLGRPARPARSAARAD